MTVADQQKVVYDLSNGAIFNYLERPYPRFQTDKKTSRQTSCDSCHSIVRAMHTRRVVIKPF